MCRLSLGDAPLTLSGSMSDVQSQRLQRVYESAKKALNIETQVSLATTHTPATVYHMDISFRTTRNKWSIAKRYSEFYRVRRVLQKFLRQFQQQLGAGESAPAPLQALEDALEAAFPRRHLRGDNAAIIDERRVALEAFVQLLVKVISCIPLTPEATMTANTREADALATLYQILRDFLAYPDKQIESEAKLKLAVLSLEDVVVDSKSNVLEGGAAGMNECCSICLGEWDEEECAGMNVVRLPCLHAFHEECLMEWLHGNTHCPMCRDEPSLDE